MEIGLTDEVRKMCGLRPLPAPGDGIDPFFCWDMARVDLGSRKLLIMSNAATSACAPRGRKHDDACPYALGR